MAELTTQLLQQMPSAKVADDDGKARFISDPLQLVYAYLFLSHKMKFHGINRYEWEVIANINHHFENLGLTKVLVLNIINEINDVYAAHMAGENITHPVQKRLVEIAQKVAAQDSEDYTQIMAFLTTRTCWRVTFSINTNAPKLKIQSNDNNPLSKVEIIAQEIESFIQKVLDNGMGSLYSNENTVIQIRRDDVKPWDMAMYHETFKTPPEASTAQITAIQQQPPLGHLELGFVAQYIEIHPNHIPSNVLLSLFLLLNYCEEYLAFNKLPVEKPQDPNQAMHKPNDEKNKLASLRRAFTGVFKEKAPKPVKQKPVSPRITITDDMKKGVLSQIQKDFDDKKPSFSQEGLLGLMSLDEGGFLLVRGGPGR